jgi:Xaa-Pro aminopeptidase
LDPLLHVKKIVTFLPNIRWQCGFTGSNGLLVLHPAGNHFVTDGRYETQAGQEVVGATVHVARNGLWEYVAAAGLLDGDETVQVQAEYLTLADLNKLRQLFPTLQVAPVERMLDVAVACKTPDEVARIQAAQRLSEAVLAEVLAGLRPGLTERAVAAEIVYGHLRRGAERMSFDPIVASGPNSALPHARPTDRVLCPGDVVLLDFGCFLDGYASDMTRMAVLGEPTPEVLEVYQVVQMAQEQAIGAARAGMTTKALDAVAREVITAAGYGEAFPHSLGHGVGLQIHEWPSVSWRTEDILPENAVITIEPGVYLPGRFGIRIEDLVLLKPDGCVRLTAVSNELQVLVQ